MQVKIRHCILNKLHTAPPFLAHRTELVADGKVKPYNREKMHSPCTILHPAFLVLPQSWPLEPHTHADNDTDGAKETPDESLFQVEPAAGNKGERDTERSEKAHEVTLFLTENFSNVFWQCQLMVMKVLIVTYCVLMPHYTFYKHIPRSWRWENGDNAKEKSVT